MRSDELTKLSNLKRIPFKITGAVTTGNSADTVYYVKPSVRCKLIGAKLYVVTAAGANMGSGGGLFTKETAVTDNDLRPNAITINTNVTAGTSVSNDDLLNFAVADVAGAKTVKVATPGADYAGAENDFNPDENDALLITFTKTSNATLMVATLELEFMPV